MNTERRTLMELEFNNISLDTKDTINKYIKPWNCENAEFSFPHLYIWGSNGKIQYAQKDNCLFLKLNFSTERPFLWPPFPLNKDVDYKKALETAISYIKNENLNPSFRSVCSPFKEMISANFPDTLFCPTRNNFDYMYLSEKLITLKGKKLHAKRNHINKFIKLFPDFAYEPLAEDHYSECMKLYDNWCTDHKVVSSTQSDERDSVEKALLNLNALNLTGGCIRINGELKAFTIGEQVSADMCQIHIEKASKDFGGLYPLINQQYAQNNCNNVKYINREEDMGLEGLRKAKESYYPDKMVEKFDAAISEQAKAEVLIKQQLCSCSSN